MLESDYVKQRLSNKQDDRCNDNKKFLDARLRGSIGCHKANQIISMIDKHKAQR